MKISNNVYWPRMAIVALGALAALTACEPTVKLAAPDKPIVINLNVKIEREVRVKVEREIDDVIRENKEIF
ncbi:MAG: YnbE family lipoprotein [Alphaproteobacteria bacterium]